MAGSWKYDEQTKSYHGLVEDLQESLGNGVEVVFAKGSNLVDDPFMKRTLRIKIVQPGMIEAMNN